jgi:hypothetical protein
MSKEKNGNHCLMCKVPFEEIHIDPNGGIYPFITSLCKIHRRLWDQWEEICGMPCYIWNDGLVGSACKDCHLTEIQAFYKAQAEKEGELETEEKDREAAETKAFEEKYHKNTQVINNGKEDQ